MNARKREEPKPPSNKSPPNKSPSKPRKDKAANAAPDAVKDPSEKTNGKPGEVRGDGEADPGSG